MTNSPTHPKTRVLTVFSLTMITIGSVDSIRNLPATALFGSQLIFFFILAAIFFLIPCALVSAELSSAWPKQGGIYVWVKEAFGEQFGFMAIWFQWIENVIWYPAILSFVAGTIGYLLNPQLVDNKIFLVSIILCAFWGATFINLLGMKSSARFSNFCAISGLLLPMTLIIALGAVWIFSGRPLHISFSPHALLPHIGDAQMWVALTGIILSFCGIEIATVHAADVHNPQKAFPQSLLYSVIIMLVTLVLGSLAIAIVLPEQKISLVAGIMQAFNAFFIAYQIHWVMPLIALMLIFGGLGSVSNWIIAPTKGLLVAAEDGHMPKMAGHVNRFGAPDVMLIIQAIIVTGLTMAFLFMPSVNGSYWLLTALAAQLYMFMYLLMFAAGIYLRYKQPLQHRPFAIPGGRIGMIIIAGMGMTGALITVMVGFIPPSNIQVGGTVHYEAVLSISLVLMCLPPFLANYHRVRRLQQAQAA